MLQEHLSQDHDMASRRSATIDAHVTWIHRHLLSEKTGRILDIGCGPGLYTSRLAKLGHRCTGIDFSPASIRYANETARAEGLDCIYQLADIRQAGYGTGLDLIMFIFGEMNTFRAQEVKQILGKVYDALSSGGTLLLEPHTFEAVRKLGQDGPSWYASKSELFSDRPHLCLMEHFWDAAHCVATTRFFVVDTESSDVTQHASVTRAFTDDQYQAMLENCGFTDITFYPSLSGEASADQNDVSHNLFALVAHKPA
jgi:cyclopropane fatty-acyl-phospholipid synthase-like methyltransferase